MSNEGAFGPCSPFFIVSNVDTSLAYYVDALGFSCRFRSPDAPASFAIVGRGATQIMLKSIDASVAPLPNRKRHPWARWDAFVFVEHPADFEDELRRRDALQGQTTHFNDDGLEGFELIDPDGYVCFFGHPV